MIEKTNGSASGTHDEYVKHKLAEYERGDVILDDVYDFLGRFICYPSTHAQVAHTLWVIHTHALHAVDSTPRLCAISPEPGSGKSRVLEITALLVPATPIVAINVSAAYLFRRVGGGARPPVILYDEADTIFGPKATPHEEVRGLLNAGFRRGAVTGRCVIVGKETIPQDFPAFAAVALAGLGTLPDTIMSRAIIFNMRRRGRTEKIEAFRQRKHERQGFTLRDRIAAWAAREWPQDATMGDFDDMPPGVDDRDADVWECLLHIAQHAGGVWPAVARAAAVYMVQEAHRRETSLGVRLLADCKTVMGDKPSMLTAAMLAALLELPEGPWKTIRKGDPLDANKLARLLKPYDVLPGMVGTTNQRGYNRADFEDAWNRYLAEEPAKAANPAKDQPGRDMQTLQAENQPATAANNDATSLAGLAGSAATRNPANPHGNAVLAGLASLAGNAGGEAQGHDEGEP